MATRFERLDNLYLPAIRRFNARMRAGGVEELFMIEEPAQVSPVDESAPIWSERILAIDDQGEVRGSYIVQWRDYWVDGAVRRLGNYQTPLSEGIIDKKYAAIGVLLTRHALASNPDWYTVGMGGLDRPLPRMLKTLGWQLEAVPFFFHIDRPSRFFRQIRHLRKKPVNRLGLNVLAFSGAGWLGVRSLDWIRAWSAPRQRLRMETVPRFGEAADAHWEQWKTGYRFAAVRTAGNLNHLYRPEDPRYRRLMIWDGSRLLGWAVLLRQPMQDNKYFGNMTVGVLADCLAAPGDLPAVIRAAAAGFADMDVDVSIANPLHAGVLEGLRQSGFLAGPTNFGFGLSRSMASLLQAPVSGAASGIHIMRGDGDGLANFGGPH